ncbi:hypothetical protein PLESTB_001245000 [Pleodorina starrii]|uniref:Uncharacterized protein n=1 Tax=Pleodorina starrii TaxID=330485 RepID=A0A9W6BT55_9CHLO|nr:hypothetical protein PLESTB_001245000 [Pleodorina starrii]
MEVYSSSDASSSLDDCWLMKITEQEDDEYLSSWLDGYEIIVIVEYLSTTQPASPSGDPDTASEVAELSSAEEDAEYLSEWLCGGDLQFAVETFSAPRDDSSRSDSSLTFSNPAYSPRLADLSHGPDFTFDNPTFCQEGTFSPKEEEDDSHSDSDFDSDSETDSETEVQSYSSYDCSFSCVCSSSSPSPSSSPSSSSPSSSGTSSPVSYRSPTWSPVGSFVRVNGRRFVIRYDISSASSPSSPSFPSASTTFTSVPAAASSSTTTSLAAAAATAAADLTQPPPPPPQQQSEALSSSCCSPSSSSCSSSSSHSSAGCLRRIGPCWEDVSLDLGYPSAEDEALFRAHMCDLEAFGLLEATSEQLMDAAISRDFPALATASSGTRVLA